ncbi:MAG: hypothetical protein LH478_02945 [Chitinophagaceae bacterium]|nr:hypothetical protein [Chitinophagaceae bacterium]
MKILNREQKKRTLQKIKKSFVSVAVTCLMVVASIKSVSGQISKKIECGSIYIVNDSTFDAHLQILNKLYLGKTIQQKHYPENRLVFFFRNKHTHARDAAAFIVLDSDDIPIEGFRLPSCFDSTVFDKKIKLKRKVMKKLVQINFATTEKAFCEYRCPNTHDLFEVLYTIKRGKVEAGILGRR